MKKALFALAGLPALSLCTAVALADVSGPPNASANGIIPAPDEIKNRQQCDGAAFFKNAFPNLTNGGSGGSDFEDFTVDGKTVRVTIDWRSDNSFDFAVTGGYAKKVGVTVDKNNFVYDYSGSPIDGIADMQLNKYTGFAADDVNHLDLCLLTLDTDAPEVSEIRVEPSTDGTTVSGEISIIATIVDESDVKAVIEIVSADGSITVDPRLITGPMVSGNEYTWSLDTSRIPEGDYVITVTATDLSIVANQFIRTKEITVIKSLLNCLDNTDGVPGVPDGASTGGCNLLGSVQLEYPGQLEPFVGGLQVSQEYVPARTDINVSSDFCDTSTYPNIAHDPRVSYINGITVIDNRNLDLADLFQLPAGKAVLIAEVVGSPCLALVEQNAPDFFDIAPLLPVGFTYDEGPVYTVTQFPEDVDGMYANIIRYSAPLNYSDPGAFQPDPQNVEQAAYQPDDRFDLVQPFAQALTNFVYNPPRTKGFKGSFWPLNTREVCPDIPIQTPATPAYIADVYQCKIDLALRYEADTRQAIIEADAFGARVSPSLNNLLNWLNRAQSQIKTQNFERCTKNLLRLESEVINGVWNDVLDSGDSRNDQGRILTYVANLLFRCEQLQLTEDYLDSLP